MMGWSLGLSRTKNESGHKAAEVLELLPPGVTDTNFLPVPIGVEYHLGKEWIVARGKTNWAMVVYYPDSITIHNIRRVNMDHLGNPLSLPLDGGNYRQSYEVTASTRSFPLMVGPRDLGSVRLATESFMFQPTGPHVDAIFLRANDESIELLKARWQQLISRPK